MHAFDLSFSKSRYFFETDVSSKSRCYSETEGVHVMKSPPRGICAYEEIQESKNGVVFQKK